MSRKYHERLTMKMLGSLEVLLIGCSRLFLEPYGLLVLEW